MGDTCSSRTSAESKRNRENAESLGMELTNGEVTEPKRRQQPTMEENDKGFNPKGRQEDTRETKRSIDALETGINISQIVNDGKESGPQSSSIIRGVSDDGEDYKKEPGTGTDQGSGDKNTKQRMEETKKMEYSMEQPASQVHEEEEYGPPWRHSKRNPPPTKYILRQHIAEGQQSGWNRETGRWTYIHWKNKLYHDWGKRTPGATRILVKLEHEEDQDRAGYEKIGIPYDAELGPEGVPRGMDRGEYKSTKEEKSQYWSGKRWREIMVRDEEDQTSGESRWILAKEEEETR